ncbi:hypothetical protein HG530_008141 [Fusarium avenaceum]|nr:hypothetical protein HG530_008141 [Fusarium avenaceum]
MILLVVDDAAWVPLLDPFAHSGVISAIEALIAKRPDDDRSMVLEPFNKLTRSINVCIFPFRIVREPLSGLFFSVFEASESVTLKIRLSNDVEAQFIGHVEEIWMGRLMGGTNRIDVGSLHE